MPNFSNATPAFILPWDADWVTAITFVGPTRRLIAGNNLGQILEWTLPDKPGPVAPSVRYEGHTNAISRLIASIDGKRLYSSSYDHTIRVWDLEAKPEGKTTLVLNGRAREEAGRRKGAKIPAPIEASVATSKVAQALTGHRDWVTAMALSRDQKTLVSGDDASSVVVWDATTLKERHRWSLKGWAYGLALSPDASRAIISERVPLVFDSGRRDGLGIWQLASGKLERDLAAEFKGQPIGTAVWHPDGKSVFVARSGEANGIQAVHVIDSTTGKKTTSFPGGHQDGITDLTIHPDGKHLLSAGRDTTIKVWDIAGAKLVGTLGKGRGGQFKDWYHAVTVSADGKWVAAGDMAGAVHVWAVG